MLGLQEPSIATLGLFCRHSRFLHCLDIGNIKSSYSISLFFMQPALLSHWVALRRVYAHTSLVMDDDEFYKLQHTFTLAQQRAIATALNTLVFRTHCPEQQRQPVKGALPFRSS